jgi:hypothetical protein
VIELGTATGSSGVSPGGPAASDSTLEALATSFAAACAGLEIHERDYVVAGRRVRLRSPNGRMLGGLTRAFSHLEPTAAGAPELRIHLWDSRSGGTIPPPLPEVSAGEPPGAFWYYSDQRVRLGFQLGTSGDARVLEVYPHAPTPALSVLDRERGEAWYWVEDGDRIPYWEQATPMVYLLDWWLRDQECHLLHAGSVGTPAGGVLLVGKSGSGKSTCALAALGTNLLYAGDDYVGVSLEPEPRVHSVYGSGKLMPDHLQRLPFLRTGLANEEQLSTEKAVVYPHEQWPGSSTAGFPLLAIVAPRVTPGVVEARAIAMPALAGLAALAPSTVFQMHTRGQDSLGRMRALAESVPSFQLEIGADVASIPRALTNLIRRLADARS